jgi:hypothetical protein
MIFVAGTLQISLMLAVDDAQAASSWYRQALGAAELWSLGSVVGLQIDGAPFFLHEPTNARPRRGWRSSSMTLMGLSLVPLSQALTAQPTTWWITRLRGASTGKADSVIRSVTSGLSATSPR